MPKMMPVTTTILGGEKAVGLVETNQRAPDGIMHRYQLLYVPRDGKVSEFRFDMGQASKYKGVKLIHIPSLMEHSVDELKNLADELRHETEIDIKDWLEIDKMNLA